MHCSDVRRRNGKLGGNRHVLLVAALMLLAAGISSGAAAAEKVALLIGNAAYKSGSTLRNPIRDARAMAAFLEKAGFETDVVLNADETAMGAALQRFARRTRGADTAFLYYSGHGMEIEGANYLIPTDASLRHPGDARYEAISLEHALASTQGASRLSISVIDACRNNTFPSHTRSSAKGFQPVAVQRRGQVIAFATAPGTVAYDGKGRLSPYTQALLEAFESAPELDVRLLFTSLGDRVSELAEADQEPFARFGRFPRGHSVSLTGGSRPLARRSSSEDQPAQAEICSDYREQTLFEAARVSESALRTFLETCPDSPLIAALPPRETSPPPKPLPDAHDASTIRRAQRALKSLGLYRGGLDGRASAELRRAITEFQERVGLEKNGRLTDETRAALDDAEKLGLARVVESSGAGRSTTEIVRAQRALQLLGFYPSGSRDGRMSFALKRAIRDFQERVGLEVDAQLSDATLAALFEAENLGLETVVRRNSADSRGTRYEVKSRAILRRAPDQSSAALALLETGVQVERVSNRVLGSGLNVYYEVETLGPGGSRQRGFVLRGFVKRL